MDILLLLLALAGYAFLWVALSNFVHSVGFTHRAARTVSYLALIALASTAAGFAYWFISTGLAIVEGPAAGRRVSAPGLLYLCGGWTTTVVAVIVWVRRRLCRRVPDVIVFDRRRLVDPFSHDIDPVAEQGKNHLMTRLPGNEILQLEIVDLGLRIPRLETALDRLSIVHLSDFHFTGRVSKEYFQHVVRIANSLNPDLVAVTGDLVDHLDCVDWIPDTLGKLTARYGVYFVIGNHDQQTGASEIRRRLIDSGLIDLGSRWIEIDVNGRPLILAGNEMPWYPQADLANAPPRADGAGPLRIVLSHSPDQFRWAQAADVDLVLAGHTHGGQIRLPLIGPVLTPSRAGVKYSAGVFHTPPTVMHVTRGVSGEHPIRLNCPPELVKLVLRTV